jgi:predicted metal-dependent enzyme (double-stranded beta helix superfamily)
MTRFLDMKSVVSELKGFAARGFPVNDIEAFLRDTSIEPADLARYSGYSDERYMRHLVHKDEDFEILVICWSSGQSAPIHGHEGELCWARVERGRLRFASYRVASEEPLVLEPIAEPVNADAGFLDGPADIHSVENLADFGDNAASLHVYSKPYGECDVYDSVNGPRRRVRLAYDSIDGRPVSSS